MTTSYSGMAARGREAALETNTSFRLRTAVEVRPYWWPGWHDKQTGVDVRGHWVWEVIGECGHRLNFWTGSEDHTQPRDEQDRHPPMPPVEWRVKAALHRHNGKPRRYRCTSCPREATT